MKKSNGLARQIAVGVVLASLFGTSAFAESRHRQGTQQGRSRSASRPSSSRQSSYRSAPRYDSRTNSGRSIESRGRSFESRSRTFESRSRTFESRSRGGESRWRGGESRGRSYSRSVPSYGRNSYNDGSRFFGRGRIERVLPYRGGYRVWLGGWGYPFYVPYRYYDPFRYRLGLFIGFNAFYDPYGYYNVYDAPGYAPRTYRDDYRDDRATVRGTVRSIDLRTGIAVVDDDSSRRDVTVLLPPRDNRVDEIRVGDYVELSGDWVRGHDYELDADRMERLEQRR